MVGGVYLPSEEGEMFRLSDYPSVQHNSLEGTALQRPNLCTCMYVCVYVCVWVLHMTNWQVEMHTLAESCHCYMYWR